MVEPVAARGKTDLAAVAATEAAKSGRKPASRVGDTITIHQGCIAMLVERHDRGERRGRRLRHTGVTDGGKEWLAQGMAGWEGLRKRRHAAAEA